VGSQGLADLTHLNISWIHWHSRVGSTGTPLRTLHSFAPAWAKGTWRPAGRDDEREIDSTDARVPYRTAIAEIPESEYVITLTRYRFPQSTYKKFGFIFFVLIYCC
jgi:hypothetical protein